MRHLLFVAVLAFSGHAYCGECPPPEASPPQLSQSTAGADEWNGPDKPKHLLLSAASGFLVAGVFKDETPLVQWSIAMIPGVVKELADRGAGGKASAKDLVFDGIGAAIGVAGGRWVVRRNFIGIQLEN